MRKKVVFCLQTMVMGGVEKELIEVLRRMRPDRFDITVVLLYIQDHGIVERLPEYVRRMDLDIDRNYYCSSVPAMIVARLKRGHWFEAADIALKKLLRRGLGGELPDYGGIPELAGSYDTAVCYHMHSPASVKYVAEKIRADRKIVWIHNDFSNTGFHPERLKYLDVYDEAVAVSQKAGSEFLELRPDFSKKLKIIPNVLDAESIVERAAVADDDVFRSEKSGKIKLLTVGRLVEQKGYDIGIAAAEILRKRGLDFIWYFIGDGPLADDLRTMIRDKNLTDCVFLAGRKENPYPSMKHCDIYVQMSRHEGMGLTVYEAKVLFRPVVCSDFAGAEDQIVDGETGLIVPCGDAAALADAVERLASSPGKREAMSRNLQAADSRKSDFSEILRCFD